jgi:hypothetical protein
MQCSQLMIDLGELRSSTNHNLSRSTADWGRMVGVQTWARESDAATTGSKPRLKAVAKPLTILEVWLGRLEQNYAKRT